MADVDSRKYYQQTFHRKTKPGKSRYGKGHRHYTTEPFSVPKAEQVPIEQVKPPKNSIMEEKLREAGLLK